MKKIYLAMVRTLDYYGLDETNEFNPQVSLNILGAFEHSENACNCIKDRAFLQFDFWDSLHAVKDGGFVQYNVVKYKDTKDDEKINICKPLESKYYYVEEQILSDS